MSAQTLTLTTLVALAAGARLFGAGMRCSAGRRRKPRRSCGAAALATGGGHASPRAADMQQAGEMRMVTSESVSCSAPLLCLHLGVLAGPGPAGAAAGRGSAPCCRCCTASAAEGAAVCWRE